MQRNASRIGIIAASFLSCIAATAMAQPSAAVCDDNGGPTICVRFDNLAGAPIEQTHFTFSFDPSGIPSVNLIQAR